MRADFALMPFLRALMCFFAFSDYFVIYDASIDVAALMLSADYFLRLLMPLRSHFRCWL